MSQFAPQVKVCESIGEMSDAARQIILAAVQARSDSSKPLVLALSGGSTPKKLYEEMHEHDLALLQGHAVQFVLGDERLLAPEDEQTNFSMATKALLRDVPPVDVIAIDPSAALGTSTDEKSGATDAWKVAADYEQKLLAQLPTVQVPALGSGTRQLPVVDVVLLGFGSDGHTASIFPDSVAATDEQHVVSVSFPSPTMSPKVWRVTLSKAVIQHAKHVVVLAGGKDKSWVVHGVLEKDAPNPAPVSRFLRECKGKVTILLDSGSGEGVAASL